MFPIVPDLQKLSITPAIPDVALPSAAVEMSKSVANVALDRLSSVQDRASASAIPSAAVDISKSLATVVAAGTNVATETGTRAFSSLFGKLGGVMSMASTSATTPDEDSSHDDHHCARKEEETLDDDIKIEPKCEIGYPKKTFKLKTDSFYESIVNERETFSPNIEETIFGDFSSNSSFSLDPEMLQLFCNHYRNSLESDKADEIEWKTLHNIVMKINSEDAALGISLILSEIMERYKNYETIEETIPEDKKIDTPEVTNESADVHEDDGWENDWSDPDLSGLSEDEAEPEPKQEQIVKRTVNVAQNLIDNVVNYNKGDKSKGVELALYIVSLAVLLDKSNISPDVAFKLPYKAVLGIANKYMKSQLKCDTECPDSNNENNCDNSFIKMLSKTIDVAKSIEPEK